LIRILATGGTFDKEYNEFEGSLFFKNTHVPEMLKLARCQSEVTIESLMMLDSLDLTDEHRSLILERCRSVPEDRIIITHGTDTMAQTARVLGSANLGKTIILTGAMIPFVFGSSDGLFNLGYAIALAQSLPPEVYVAMNGRKFHWSNVRKNREAGVFEEIQP
jgi:L-asparaginase